MQSRQAFHQKLNRSLNQEKEEQQLAVIITRIREDHPTMCCRYMYFMIKPDCMGRDAFEQFCHRYGFMTKRKINFTRTTYSIGAGKFENLTKDFIINGIDQVWSSDLTYYKLKDRFCYITFIIDNYSRRILGHVVSAGMQTEQTTLPALREAIKTRNHQLREGIIFHSDGGGQYYDKAFLELTSSYKMRNSMCDMAWENGKSERINGIIKNNYLAYWQADTEQQLRINVVRAVNLYNSQKPHSALGRKTPIGLENELATKQQPGPLMSESIEDALSNLNGGANHKRISGSNLD